MAPAGGLPVGELLAILRRRRWAIIWVVLLVTGIATLAGLQVTPTYTATALVTIEPREQRVVNVEQVLQDLPGDSASVETQIKVLQSYHNLVRAVERLGLFTDPEFFPTDSPAGEGLPVAGPLGVVVELLPREWLVAAAGWLPERWLIATGLADETVNAEAEGDMPASQGDMPASEELGGRVLAALQRNLDRAVGTLADDLKIAQSGYSYVLSVSYSSTDPHKAARIANGVADAYVEGQLDEKLSATTKAHAWLAERVEQLREELLAAERAIQDYRANNGLVDGEGVALGAQQMAILTTELIDARAERTAKQARLERVRELRRGGKGYEALADVLASPIYVGLRQEQSRLLSEQAQLSREYGERHPRILQLQAELRGLAEKMDQEMLSIVGSLENEVEVARSREEALRESLQQAKGETTLTGQAGVQLRELEREAAANRSLYETFLVRFKETEQQQQILRSDARVISPAQVPDRPSSPSAKLFTAVGLTASLVLGSVLALLLEQLDKSLRNGRQIERLLQVPALGLVPRVAGLRRGEALHGYLLRKPRSAYAEGIRGLYTQTRLADVDHPPKVIVLTSALPGEGKTSTAASLATFAAQLQQRTLLIDLDLRRPRVGTEFGIDPDAGMVELMAGAVEPHAAVQRDDATGVDLLLAGTSHSNPTALLTSERLDTLLQEMRRRYDYIVVDSPPLLGVTDAKILSLKADAVVFIVRWERTKQDAAESAVKELKDVSANVAGAVLTKVDMKRHASYGYGDAGQYYSKYQKYYEN